MDTLDRLLQAVAKDPHLEYQLFARMRDFKYYSPWVSHFASKQMVLDSAGKTVGWIQPDTSLAGLSAGAWVWHVSNAMMGGARTEALAKQNVEDALIQEGWKQIPLEFWVSPKVPLSFIILPWEVNGNGDWCRIYSPNGGGMYAALVTMPNEVLPAYRWETWTDGGEPLASGVSINDDWARYDAEQSLKVFAPQLGEEPLSSMQFPKPLHSNA